MMFSSFGGFFLGGGGVGGGEWKWGVSCLCVCLGWWWWGGGGGVFLSFFLSFFLFLLSYFLSFFLSLNNMFPAEMKQGRNWGMKLRHTDVRTQARTSLEPILQH